MQRYEMLSSVARYIVQLDVLVRAQGHDEADPTIGSCIACQVCIHVAPLEVPYRRVPRVIDAYDGLL